MPHRYRPGCLPIAVVALGALLARAPSAEARAGGIVADACDGCHGSAMGTPPSLTVTANPAMPKPGDAVTFTLTIQAPTIKVGGAYITTGGIGALQALAGEGLALNAQGLTHTSPKPASNGAVTFKFGWQAPAKAGAVDVHVAALAGNGNNASSGDSPGTGDFEWVFGCTGTTFYADLDRDGYGSKSWGTRLGCMGDAPPTGYAAVDGDCDENDQMVHPGATEVCNMKDDDCNGQIDENAPPVMMWPDADGDGYYPFQNGTPKIGCGHVAGYAASGGDCNDHDATIHPGATEVCNLKDDNCDGEVDERVRPTCGLGWCSRYSPTCNAADCVPGPPATETCNSFDDDCDGELDNGACPGGMICSGSQCVSNGGVGPGATGGGAGSNAGRGGAASGGATGTGSGGGGQSPGSGCAVAPISGGGQDGSAGAALAVLLGLVVLRRTKRR
ncbi:MAG: putative metal-binding motif-containing protein [Polyangia bacterium]